MPYKAPVWDEDPEVLRLWESEYPGKKIPGMPEQHDGYCNSKLRDKKLRDLGIIRYCSKNAGYGTDTHVGYGNCKFHGGKSPNGITSGERLMIKEESTAIVVREAKVPATIGERLSSPGPIAPPEVEVLKLAGEMKEWAGVMREKISELTTFDITDAAGIEHARALVELYERALDRYSELIQFMIKIGVRERVVAIQEQQGQALALLVLGLITNPQLGLTTVQIDLSRELFAERARAMGARLSPDWAEGIENSLGEDEYIDAEIVD
jgi:hypothetical protein